jgi:hypothetical protein
MPSRGPGLVPSSGSGIVPSFGPTIIPSFGAGIVPPLVSAQPCCQGGADHRRHHRPFFADFGVAAVNGPTFVLQPVAPAPAPALPPPADFDPRLVTLKPFIPRPGDPASVRILRPGQPDEIVKVQTAAR